MNLGDTIQPETEGAVKCHIVASVAYFWSWILLPCAGRRALLGWAPAALGCRLRTCSISEALLPARPLLSSCPFSSWPGPRAAVTFSGGLGVSVDLLGCWPSQQTLPR